MLVLTQEEILGAIKNVIRKRRERGAEEENILKYKNHLITKTWRNCDKDFKDNVLDF